MRERSPADGTNAAGPPVRAANRSRPSAHGLGLVLALGVAAALGACSAAPGDMAQSLHNSSSLRRHIAELAMAQIGDAYEAHMAGPARFDAAGLAYFAYRQNGRALPRSLSDQLHTGEPIPLAKAAPGDLVFFRSAGGNDHTRLTVGVLVGKQSVVMALPDSQDGDKAGVRRISLGNSYWSQRLVGVARVLPGGQSTADRSG